MISVYIIHIYDLTYSRQSSYPVSVEGHSKQCWVVLTQIWVKYGQTQMLG